MPKPSIKVGEIIEMKKLHLLIILFLLQIVLQSSATAQSLKPENPYPLQAGINKGTSDSLVGTHYWYFYAAPGNSRVVVRFKQDTTLYGASVNNTTLTITLTDEKRTWRNTKVITPKKNASEAVFTAEKVKTKMKIIVSISPPNQNLIRMGGDYEIEADGDVKFDEVKKSTEPIVRTYESKVNSYGSVKFLGDGTIESSDGSRGTWKLFDAENKIYIIIIENERFSLKYRPGYGLVKAAEPNMIVFQELR